MRALRKDDQILEVMRLHDVFLKLRAGLIAQGVQAFQKVRSKRPKQPMPLPDLDLHMVRWLVGCH